MRSRELPGEQRLPGHCHRSRSDGAGEPQRLALEAALIPAARSPQPAIHDALRLLAVWALRAARGHTVGQNQDLTVLPPEAMNAPRTSQMEKTP